MSVGFSDIVAAYGAIVASIVGWIQYREWRRKRRFLFVSARPQIDSADGDQVILSISNRGSHPVHLEYVAIAKYLYSWKRPWRIDPISMTSMQKIDRPDDKLTTGSIDGHLLNPGEMVFGFASKTEFAELDGYDNWKRDGWKNGDCILIEHSQSDKPVISKVEWLK